MIIDCQWVSVVNPWALNKDDARWTIMATGIIVILITSVDDHDTVSVATSTKWSISKSKKGLQTKARRLSQCTYPKWTEVVNHGEESGTVSKFYGFRGSTIPQSQSDDAGWYQPLMPLVKEAVIDKGIVQVAHENVRQELEPMIVQGKCILMAGDSSATSMGGVLGPTCTSIMPPGCICNRLYT